MLQRLTLARRPPAAPERTRRVNVEHAEAAAQFIIDGGDVEMAAAAVETGHISRTELRPIARLHAPREQRIEQERSRRRQRKATLRPPARSNPPLNPCPDPPCI